MKNTAIAHEQMLLGALNTIGKAGITSMTELHQIPALDETFLAALTPWLEDQLQEASCAALINGMDVEPGEAQAIVLAALINQNPAFAARMSGSCRIDLILRQAHHGAEAALSLLHHTVHHICLDRAHTLRRAG